MGWMLNLLVFLIFASAVLAFYHRYRNTNQIRFLIVSLGIAAVFLVLAMVYVYHYYH